MYLKRIEYLKSQGSLFKELFYQLNTFYYIKSAKERIEDNQPSLQRIYRWTIHRPTQWVFNSIQFFKQNTYNI